MGAQDNGGDGRTVEEEGVFQTKEEAGEESRRKEEEENRGKWLMKEKDYYTQYYVPICTVKSAIIIYDRCSSPVSIQKKVLG